MILICYILLLHSVFAQIDFGTPYLTNSRLCQQWECINTKLGLPEHLPPRDQYKQVLKSLLPEDDWQGVVDKVLDKCYGDRPRIYANTCSGQAVLHCAVEHLIEYCPDQNLRKDDACAPLTSIAGFTYMFTQSRYENLEKNLPKDTRPIWFMSNYFSSKCCNLPELFNSTVLKQCGLSTVVHYYTHQVRNANILSYSDFKKQLSTTPRQETDSIQVIEFNDVEHITTESLNEYIPRNVVTSDVEESDDPLDCCDMNEFIQSSWRTECNFGLHWDNSERLTIKNQTHITTTSPPLITTTTRTPNFDVKVVPLSCDNLNCVFDKLNIVSASGVVDRDAFTKLLDNFTTEYPSWTKAKARVVTKCLSKTIEDYEADCEINKILACTLDVLSENCPYNDVRRDPCKRKTISRNGTLCQINSSKYRPRNRRQFCEIPSLILPNLLTECGIDSITTKEYLPEPPTTVRPRRRDFSVPKYTCQDLTDSTKCLMTKMGILNKYSFMDYFKMKDRIRHFTSDHPEWSSLTDTYLSTFTGMPLYGKHCSSPKKLLNVLDTMLMTCPVSRRKNTPKCNNMFTEMAYTPPVEIRHARGKLDQTLGHFSHIFLSNPSIETQNGLFKFPHSNLAMQLEVKDPMNPNESVTEVTKVTHKQPIYDFGILNSGNVPPVEVIDLKPLTTTKRPLVLLPVYQRSTETPKNRLKIWRPYNNDGIFRSAVPSKNKIEEDQTSNANYLYDV